MNRRAFLKTMGAGLGPLAIDQQALLRALAASPAGSFAPQTAANRDPIVHVLSRLTYGVTPRMYRYVREIGVEAFIEEQLSPETLDDSAVDAYLSVFSPILAQNGGPLRQRYNGSPETVIYAIIGAMVMRGLFSRRQLYERMVHFFTDHFSVFIGKEYVTFLKVDHDRDAVRPYAMATFADALRASAHSPAILQYLDNVRSRRRGPNENFAREFLELHTLGVDGGYTEADVKEVARCFTGWSMTQGHEHPERHVVFMFRPNYHDDNSKTVLDTGIPSGLGHIDGEMVIDLVARHPSTARHISRKLIRRFVSDTPPDALVDECAVTFLETGGDLRSVLRVIFDSPEFWNAPPKLKQPYEYVLSLARAVALDVDDPERFTETLRQPLEAMGNVPLTWSTPDGFPDVASAWMHNMMPRWNAAIAAARGSFEGALANTSAWSDFLAQDGVPPDVEPALMTMGQVLLGYPLSDADRDTLLAFAQTVEGNVGNKIRAGLALLLASPAFQYR